MIDIAQLFALSTDIGSIDPIGSPHMSIYSDLHSFLRESSKMNGSAEDDVESAVLEDGMHVTFAFCCGVLTLTLCMLFLCDIEVRISSYVDSHLQEMLAMEKACTSVRGNNLAMQSVPNHMRRRAAAHDTKRLPKRLRMRAHWEVVPCSFVFSGCMSSAKKLAAL